MLKIKRYTHRMLATYETAAEKSIGEMHIQIYCASKLDFRTLTKTFTINRACT